jgi:flagellar basal-body rod protein FlgC
VIFAAQPQGSLFTGMLNEQLRDGVNAVHVLDIVSDPNGTRLEYEPDHPDANAQGYVAYPNVNVMREMVDLISATRAYEANVTAINSSKDMALRALQIGRV